MDLNKLLRQSGREQVDLNLSPPPIAGRELRAGQYSVAVQRVPDASQTTLGKLANALGKVNPLIAKYGETKITETDLQNKVVDDTLAGMSPEDKAELMRSTEEKIVKKLGGSYELNPVATIRAKKLIGAEYVTGFTPYLDERIQEFKAERVNTNGDKPSPMEINQKINEFTQTYIEQNPQLSSNELMKAGFFEQASPYINEKKQTLPGQLAGQHKAEVLMPNIVKSLKRFNEGNMAPEALAMFWKDNTRFLTPSEQEKILDETAATLNFTKSEENLDRGIEFYESMRLAGIQIGNTPIDADDPKADNTYTRRVQELEDMREEIQQADINKHVNRLNVFGIETSKKFREFELKGLDDDDEKVFEFKEQEEERIKNDPDIPEKYKQDYIDKLDLAIVSGFSSRTTEIDRLTGKFTQSKAVLTPASVGASNRSAAVAKIESKFGLEGFDPDNYDDLVDIAMSPGNALTQTLGDKYEITAIRSGLKSIINNADNTYTEMHVDTMEKVSQLERAGDTVQLGDKTYTVQEGKDVQLEQLRISSDYLISRGDELRDQVMADIDEVVNNSKKQAEEEQKSAEDTAAQLKAEQEKLSAPDKAAAGLSLGRTMTQRGREISMSPGGLTGSFVEENYPLVGGGIGRTFQKTETDFNMPQLMKGTEQILKTRVHSPEDQKEILTRVGKIHEESIPVYRDIFKGLNATLKLTSKPNSRNYINPEQIKRRLIQRKYEVFGNRRIVGLSAADANTLLRTKYFPEGARVATPIEFLKGELTGLGPDSDSSQPYRSSLLIKEATDEDLKDIADKVGVDYERLKAAQSTYKNYLDGVVPQKAEPEVKPAVTKSLPADDAQLELNFTKEQEDNKADLRITEGKPEQRFDLEYVGDDEDQNEGRLVRGENKTPEASPRTRPVAPSSNNARITAANAQAPGDTPRFLTRIARAESFHGGTPQLTKDAREKGRAAKNKTRDIGYGHKVTAQEMRSGVIQGVRFLDDQGDFISITEDQALEILGKDLEYHTNLARKGWDPKLAKIGTSWEELDAPYKEVLSSLAFNVGGNKAGSMWANVLTAAKNRDLRAFAKGIRRKDNGKNTAGMDNRAAKELYAAGLIENVSEVKNQLPLVWKSALD